MWRVRCHPAKRFGGYDGGITHLRENKKRRGPYEVPTPPDIAPTGELAGLPARDFLNLVRPRVSPRGPIHTAKNRGARTRYFVSLYPIFFA